MDSVVGFRSKNQIFKKEVSSQNRLAINTYSYGESDTKIQSYTIFLILYTYMYV